eukprot:2006241-Rhodomonas_salina.2
MEIERRLMDPWQVMDTVSKSEQEPVGEEDRASMDEQVEEDVEAEEANAQEHSHDGDQNAGKKKKKKKKKKKSSKLHDFEPGRTTPLKDTKRCLVAVTGPLGLRTHHLPPSDDDANPLPAHLIASTTKPHLAELTVLGARG